ncbi:MAG: hypothetical protein OXC99_11530 [Chloroflexi bacterium]|nr:hypothetical protein [Chloroflexota bacterium]
MPLIILIAAVGMLCAAYLVWRARRKGSAPLSGDPSTHTEAQIIRSMKAYWKDTCGEQYRFLKGMGPEVTGESDDTLATLKTSWAEVHTVQRHEDGRVIAMVSLHARGFVVEGPVQVLCAFRDGVWTFRTDRQEEDTQPDVQASIGEPVVLQTSWKEPPFAITVLGKPERIAGDRQRVRVPVRYTGITHRWSPRSATTFFATIYTSENADGERVAWVSEPADAGDPALGDVVLVEGGSYDGYIHFTAGEGEERRTAPRRRFVALHWHDDSEAEIIVDLRRSAVPSERVRFRDGTPEQRLDKRPFDVWLRGLGSQWADLGDAPVAGIGDVVRVAAAPDADEWWDVTVVGVPEGAAASLIRLPLRVTSKYRGTRRFDDDLLQLGTAPDEFGAIQHLWERRDFRRASGAPDDCLHGVELKRNESREGAVYFSPPTNGRGRRSPSAPFTTLWYGINYLEMPVGLAPNSGTGGPATDSA